MLPDFGDKMRLNVGGKELVADFEVQGPTVPGARFSIVLESKNGQGRNPDYFDALEELLRILGSAKCEILEIHLASSRAMKVSKSERVLPMSFPLSLPSGTDFLGLRRLICRAQASIITSSKSGSGNSHRRIQIEVRSPLSAEEILGGGSIRTR